MKKNDFSKIRLAGLKAALVLILMLMVPSAAMASWPQDKSDLKADPEVIWGVLDNGFRYALMKNTEPQDRVSMHLNIQAGSLHETDAERGLAHFLEHLLFQGSENFPPGELVKYFQSIGMQFGPDANAHTGLDETVYDIILPNGDEKSIADGLTVMKDYAQGALLAPEQIDSERKVVLAEKRSRDSASYRTFEATFEFEYPNALISKRLPIGVEDVIKGANRELLKGFYDAWYRPETMMLVMVGDFDPASAASMIDAEFSDLAARAPARPAPDLGRVRHYGIKPFHHFEEEAGDASVGIEVLEMLEPRTESAEFKKWMLKKDVADSIVQNRLDSLQRKADTPFTSASVSSGVFLKRFFYADISAKSSGENWEKALTAIEHELRKALLFGFTASELDRVKKDYLAELKTSAEKASTRDSRKLARQIIRAVNSDRVFMSPKQKLELFEPALDALTVDEAHEAFKESWDKRHRLVMVTGNAPVEKDAGGAEAYVLSRFTASRQIPVAAPEEQEVADFPYLPEPEKAGAVAERNEVPDLGIVQIDFENGLRLNYKKTDFKAKEIRAVLSFGPGESGVPLDKPGLSNLSVRVVKESGVGPLDAEDLNRALAGKNTTVNFDIEEDAFEFKADTVPEEIDLMLQLLRAYVTDPAFRPEAYRLAMERYRLSYLENSRSVEGAVQIRGDRFLAWGDPRFGLPDYETFEKLTLEDVRAWIENSLRNHSLELSVVGDFDAKTLEKSVAKYLGNLETGNSDSIVDEDSKLPDFPEGDSLSLPVKTDIPKAIVMLAYPTDDFWDISRTRRLSILGEIVSERLRVKIREEMGASYSQYAYNRSSKAYEGYGVFKQVVYAEPKDVRTLTETMKKIVEEIKRDGIEEDELHRSLEPTITSIREMRQKNRYWLHSVLSGSKRHPEQLEWARTFLEDYGSITKKDVLKMADKYLDNEKAAEIVVVPAL